MHTVTPFLWFDDNAEEAMDFYVEVFNGIGGNAKTLSKNKGPDGKLFTGEFELNGQKFMVLNAGPTFKFNEAISFFVSVDTQEEIDYYWNKLTANGGEESQCGWLKDKFGLSWQIIPKMLGEAISNPKGMEAMMGMKKIIIKDLEEAVK